MKTALFVMQSLRLRFPGAKFRVKMTFTGDDSVRNRSRAVESVLLKLCLKYAAVLGEEYCKILCDR